MAVLLGLLFVVACSVESAPESDVEESRAALTTALVATADTQVDEGQPNTNYGSAPTMGIHGKTIRALVMFDADAIARLDADSARVEVTIAGSAGPNWGTHGRNVGIFRLTRPWTELGASVNCAVDTNTSNDKADCSQATAWDMRLSGSVHPWAEPATSRAIITKGQRDSVSFDVTADMARFRSGTPFYGWLLMTDLDDGGNPGDVELETRTSADPPRLIASCSGDASTCESSDGGDAASPSDSGGGGSDAGGTGTDAGGSGNDAGFDAAPSCTPQSCDDSDPCTTDLCTQSGCTHAAAADGTSCSDNNVCTVGDSCISGSCAAGAAMPVDDANVCTIDSCDPVLGAIHTPVPAGTGCPNGNLCDGNETCDGAGSCIAGTAPVVDDNNPCTDDACDPGTGVTHTPRPAGDLACSDANACNGIEACDGAGACVQGAAPPIDDGNVCTLDGCSPISGPFHTPVPGCDPTPVRADDDFETRASLLGRLVDRNGAGLTGATFTVYDERRAGAPRSDVVVSQASDGSFRLRLTTFPEQEPPRSPVHRLVLVINMPGTIEATRVAFARPGDPVPLGDIRLIPRDPAVTNIGPAGGTATDSRGRIQIVVPPGALDTTVPIQITPLDAREDFPSPLPHVTVTNYGMVLEPTGTTFSVPATVRVTNSLNLPTNLTIPVGSYNEVEGRWDTIDLSKWDGERFTFSTTHFSKKDMNASAGADLVLHIKGLSNPNRSGRVCGSGSSWTLGGGSTTDVFPLPSVHSAGEDFGVSLHYDSGLAGSRKLGAAPDNGGAAVPTASLAVSFATSKATTECVPRGDGGGGSAGATKPGTCSAVIGSCGAGGVTLDVGAQPLLNHFRKSITPPLNATELSDGEAWLEVPYAVATGGNASSAPLARTAFIPTRMTVTSGASTTCTGGGGTLATTFGASNPLAPRTEMTAQEGPMVETTRKVLMHHRFTSPFGSGWAIRSVSRVYLDGDHAALVAGDGQEEEFHPRARLDRNGLSTLADDSAFARDFVTGESFVITRPGGVIYRIDPVTGATTQVVPSVGLSDTIFHGFAVAYVNGNRRFVIAHESGIYDVAPGGGLRTLRAEATLTGIYRRMALAAHGSNAYFTVGEADTESSVLFKVDLTQASPTPIAMSLKTGGDVSLYPAATLGGVTFTGPRGLAFAADGTLYLADALRHAVYAILPEASGELGPTSPVNLVLGDGTGSQVLPIGESAAAETFSINQPHHLAVAEDGTVFVALPFGVVNFDPQARSAELLFIDNNKDEIQPTFTNFASGQLPSFLAVAKNFMLATSPLGTTRINIDLLSSDRDPTRTITTDANGVATLTDTTQDIVDRFDRAGRLIEHRRRTGKTLYTVTYVDAKSDFIDYIADAAAGHFQFGYSNGKITGITDPAGGFTSFTVNDQGDLVQFIEPDGATHTLGYDAHHLTKKTSPRGDETKYTYADDGTLATTEKPAHETYELHSSGASPLTYNATGQLEATGSYTDSHGVTHLFTPNADGEIEKETYTADGVQYVRQAVIPATVVFNDPFISTRQNSRLRRISRWTLNGVPVGPRVDFDSFGRPAASGRVGAPNEERTFWTYDANGRLATFAPAEAYRTKELIERDSAGRILRIFDAARDSSSGSGATGRQTSFTWRSDDQPATITQHGVTTTFSYDDAGGTRNLIGSSDTLGRVVTFGHDPRGNVTSTSDGTASSLFDFDANNRLLRSFDGLGNQTTFRYTHASCGCTEEDLVTGIHTPDLEVDQEWSFEYGPEGRLAQVSDPDGNVESMTYKPTGELASVTDRLQRTSTMQYDQLGRLTSLVDIANRAHVQSYTAPTAGAWVGPSLSGGSADSASPTASLTGTLRNGDYQIGLNAFDTEGFPAQISLYRDATFELSYRQQFDNAYRLMARYDRANRAVSSTDLPVKADTDGTFDDHQISYNLDTAAPVVTGTVSSGPAFESSSTNYNFEFDATNQAGFGAGIEGPSSHVFTRDAGGRLTNSTNRFYFGTVTTSPEAMNAPASTYVYRPDGRLSEVDNVDGTHVFTYDARGLVHTQTVNQGADGENGTYTYEYDEVGRNTSLTFPDQHVRTQRYDSLGRIVERCYKYPTVPSIADRCYGAGYDVVGNVIHLRDPEGSDDIEVDALDRLKKVTRSDGHVEDYAYNSLGALSTNAGIVLNTQRSRLDGAGNADSAVPATLGGSPVTLDRGGRVTSLGGTPFNFSREGYLRAVGASSSPLATFAIDSSSRRAWMKTPNDLQAFVYEGANAIGVMRHIQVLNESRDTAVQRWLFDGLDHPLRLTSFKWVVNSATTPPTIEPRFNFVYLEVDLAGNVRRVRGQSGEDYGGFRYTAFGQQLEDTTSFGFLDPSPDVTLRWKARPLQHFGGTEVYDMRARQWVPELGVFLSIDEYRYHSPRTTLWGWPGQNPLKWSDPSGHDAVALRVGGFSQSTIDSLLSTSANIEQQAASDFAAGNYLSAYLGFTTGFDVFKAAGVASLFREHPFGPGDMAGMMMMCPEGAAAGTFANQLPGSLESELAAARGAGARPIRAGTPAFAKALNEGTVKWVVTKNGDLIVSPHTVNGVEISHAVLSGGEPVLAAGQADVGVAGGQMTGIEITNHSGHFMPSAESTQIGREAFANQGIVFPE